MSACVVSSKEKNIPVAACPRCPSGYLGIDMIPSVLPCPAACWFTYSMS
uniref:Uncharacterized protein n=1 Tax=Arundo donax TaxID=35708 RepID=A0A0A8ZK04_ARUDO